MKKKLLILILLLSSLFAEIDERKSDVYFANGIDTSEGEARAALNKLKVETKIEYPSSFKDIKEWKASYNHSYGMGVDLYESMIQKIYEGDLGINVKVGVWESLGLFDYTVKGVINKIIKSVAKDQLKAQATKTAQSLAKIAFVKWGKGKMKGKLTEVQLEAMFEHVLNHLIEEAVGAFMDKSEEEILAQKIKDTQKMFDNFKESVQDGHGVIVVAHSQGNFFVNDAYDSFVQNDPYFHTAWMQKYIHVLGVATPASYVAGGGKYLTFHNDIVQIVPASLGTNFPIAKKYYYTDIEGNDIENFASLEAHAFLSSYMQNPPSWRTILLHISTSVEQHRNVSSQWVKEKEVGCGCDKRITLIHSDSIGVFDYLMKDKKVLEFNENGGKIYRVEDDKGTERYVKASPTGIKINDKTANVASNGGICYTLDGTSDDPIRGHYASKPKKGVVEVSLNWQSVKIDLDIKMEGWEEVGEYDIQDDACPTEHYVIEGAESIEPGHYYVNIGLKDAGNIKEVDENITILIKALGKQEMFPIHIEDISALEIGRVADIHVEYVENKPVFSIESPIGYPQPAPIGGGFVRQVSCQEKFGLYNCKCMPCTAKIIPYLEQALAGPLSGADVELHIASEFKENTPLYKTKTSTGSTVISAGIISVPKSFTLELNDDELYILHVRGGIDIDSNDDFIKDNLETTNRGSLHTVLSGRDLKAYGYKLNILTEISYQMVKDDIGVLSNKDVLHKLEEVSSLLLKDKVFTEYPQTLSYADVIAWLPSFDKELLFYDYDNFYNPIVQKIYRDEDIYEDAYNLVYGVFVEPRLKSGSYELPEDASSGTVVGKIEIVSEGKAPIDNLVLTGDGSENFILNSSGEIIVSENADLDFELKQLYNLKVIAFNAFGSSSVSARIYIRNVVDAPFVESFSGGRIFSNAAPDTVVGKLGFNQGSSGISEMVLEGDGHQYFKVDLNGNIKVSALGLSDVISDSNFNLNIKAKNSFGYSRNVSVTIAVIKVFETPRLQNFKGFIDENSEANTLIGKVEFNEGDSAVNAFVLSGEGSENFKINLQGELRVEEGAVLDYESVSYYSLKLSARNEQGTSLGSKVEILVNNLEDIPILKTGQVFDLDEDVEPGTFLGNVLESTGLSPIESISSSDDKFRIDLEGNLYLKDDAQLDYETQTHHFIYSVASNAYGKGLSVRIDVEVNDVSDVPILTPLVTNILENSSVGESVGTVSFSRGTSSIIEMNLFGLGSENFTIDLMGQITVSSGVVIDYEQVSQYNLFAEATNSSGKSNKVAVKISVVNELDAPELNNISINLQENTQGFVLVQNIISKQGLSAITSIEIRDKNGSLSKTLQADVNGQLTVTDDAILDYEKFSVYQYSAKAFNLEGPSAVASIKINLTNVLDAPELESFSAFVDENATIGTIVGNINFNPGLSPVTSMHFNSLYPDDPIPFAVSKDGVVTVKDNLNYEKIKKYDFLVYATNDSGESSKSDINIKVNDIVDSPILNDFTASISEDAYEGEYIGKISYVQGLEPITQMVIDGEGNENFVIDKNGNISLAVNSSLNYEEIEEYNLFVQAFSLGYDSNIVNVRIKVVDVDEKARAGIGLWGDAGVKIYKLEDNGTKSLVFTEVTSSYGTYEEIGRFDSHRLELEKDKFYLYEVSGGEEYDENKDGVLDVEKTPNLGTLHAIVKGEWVRKLEFQMSVNLMTDVYYYSLKDELDAHDFIALEEKLLATYNEIIDKDIDGSDLKYHRGNGLDALWYNPIVDFSAWNKKFSDSIIYMTDLFYTNYSDYKLFTNNTFMNIEYYNQLAINNALSLDESYLYVSNKYGSLKIYNLKSGIEPKKYFSEFGGDIELSSDNVLLSSVKNVGEASYQLSLMDTSNIEKPILLSVTDLGYIYGSKISRNKERIYVTSGYSNTNINSYDISNNLNVSETELNFKASGEVSDITFSTNGRWMFLASNKAGLQVVDTGSYPFEIVGSYLTDGHINKITHISDLSKLILSVNKENKSYLQVVDISDINNIINTKSFEVGENISTFSVNKDETIFVTSNESDRSVNIYENVGGLYNEFVFKSKISGILSSSYPSRIYSIYILESDSTLVVVTNGYLMIYNISDRTSPILINEYLFIDK